MASPKLRFKEFEADWTLQNLSDSFSLISGYAFPSSASTDSGAKWLKIADVGIQEMTPNNPSYLPLEYLDKYSQFVVNKDDYVIALTRPILNKKLKIAKIGNFYDGALLNQRVAKISSRSNNLDFIYSLLQKSKTVEELENSIAGTDPPNLSLNDVKEIKLGFPSKEEQTKIASFLSAVDEKINLLTQKYELLSQYKQGLMQKLFSQQIRFKADDGREFGEWENLKFRDVITIKYGKDHKALKEGNIPVLGTGGIMRYVDSYLYDGDSILIGRKGTIDKPQFISGKFWTVDTLFYTEIGERLIPKFVYQQLLLVNWLNLNEATGVPSLNTTSIGNIEVKVPCLEEQTKIANFLSAIDQKIAGVAQQIEQAKQWKKGLLQQMFV
ncbi:MULTISPECIES: restriction endonuclease subunit S [unclassified Acinetobacter]|uniref:restriction endonuclease subunit S n=1 Tax=unclassified Acinetobacter TaxID=196816 RepID=UPI0015D31712|nr:MULTISPECIES: restriction endonuclease subunit S [unclassified Acinetobacter]UUS60104.1 restriction endonuclease subunit S [Acinetobacter sp. YH16056_T]